MIDSLEAGQTIRCTIKAEPRRLASEKTIRRLMQMDPAISKGLRVSQARRRTNLHVYVRGNRDWTDREKCPNIAQVKTGESWSMVYSPLLANDLKSVASYIDVAKA
ncbi:MAG: hypothetical protein H6815_10640 [Phycisphaeraceae bacterium]|nr:hypothetical protein [Phycisphaerales bacterium]MCB9860894.1 hypothetical protein [Phycisphaeraceae bacterium]